jgi:CVNH domain
VWGGRDFSQSAQDVRLEGHRLTAALTKEDGGHRERQGVDLEDRISNQDGRLSYGKNPPPATKKPLTRVFLPSA